jgi:1-acyl-sn-glycerol-3-phosphate acyltransferase
MQLFRKDIFGNFYLTKRILYLLFGFTAHYRFKKMNKAVLNNVELLDRLPNQNVLFVSNHQTYFADVAFLFLVFASAKSKFFDRIGSSLVLFTPRLNAYFVAAQETMKSGILPKIFTYAGGILIKRTWRESGQDVKRQVDMRDISKINEGLADGWVVTFPQGTTTPYVQGRKGTAHIIKTNQPIVVPVVINGFRRAFDKKGLLVKKRGVEISVTFKEPLVIDYEKSSQEILDQVMVSIEQTEDFKPPMIRKESKEPEN